MVVMFLLFLLLYHNDTENQSLYDKDTISKILIAVVNV